MRQYTKACNGKRKRQEFKNGGGTALESGKEEVIIFCGDTFTEETAGRAADAVGSNRKR